MASTQRPRADRQNHLVFQKGYRKTTATYSRRPANHCGRKMLWFCRCLVDWWWTLPFSWRVRKLQTSVFTWFLHKFTGVPHLKKTPRTAGHLFFISKKYFIHSFPLFQAALLDSLPLDYSIHHPILLQELQEYLTKIYEFCDQWFYLVESYMF